MKTISLKVNARSESGKKAAKNLRAQGLVPGVIYGGEETIHFSVPQNSLNPVVFTGEFFRIDIDIDGKVISTITKDIQFHPVTDEVMHIDFQELVSGRRVRTSIPVKLEGRPEGVAVGGVLQQKLLRVKVRVTPEDMVENLTLDVTSMKLGDSKKVKEIESGNIEVLDSPNVPVATVITPRSLRSAQSKGGDDAESTTEA